MMGRDSVLVPDEDVVGDLVLMFLQSYRHARPKGDVLSGKQMPECVQFASTRFELRLGIATRGSCHGVNS